jgi:uncharacterized repeat protein (TIGR02543 family)
MKTQKRERKFITSIFSLVLSLTMTGLVSNPVQAATPAPADGVYGCSTGLQQNFGESSFVLSIEGGVVTSGAMCAGAVVIPDGVTEIGYDSFAYAGSVTSISLPSSVKVLGDYAFYQTGLTSISLPEGLTTIGEEVFFGVAGLGSISIPASVTSIGYDAIGSAPGLTSITVASANPNYSSIGGALFNKDGTTLISYPSGNSAASYTVPSTVTSIAMAAFFNSPNLESIFAAQSGDSALGSRDGVLFSQDATTLYAYPEGRLETSYTIPATVTSIKYGAFNSSRLKSVTIPSSVTSIENYAFKNSANLASVYFQGNADLSNMSDYAFLEVAQSATAYIDEGATGFNLVDGKWKGLNVSSGNYSAVNCVDVGSVTGAGTFTRFNNAVIGNYGCEGKAVIPSGVTEILENAFYGSDVMSSYIPASVSSIGAGAFYDSALTDIYFYGSAPTVGSNAFNSSSNRAKAHIKATATGFGTAPTWNELIVQTDFVTPAPQDGSYVCTTGSPLGQGSDPSYTITNGAVSEGNPCSGAVVIPEGVTSIGNGAFYKVTGLTSVFIPDGVASIGEAAFNGTGLTSITIPASVTSIAIDAFSGIPSLPSISVASGSQSFSSIDGVLFNADATVVYQYPSGKSGTSYTIPQGVTSIGPGAFASTALSSVTIPRGVTTIGLSAFYDSDLTSITIPSSVTTIGTIAFKSSPTLADVYFAGNAPSVGFDAFGDVASGATAHIRATATGFGTETWNGLVVQNDFVAPAPADGSYVCTTGLPVGQENSPSYTITSGVVESGSSCVGAVAIPDGVTEIGDLAFYAATGLTSVSIPEGVLSIGSYAFGDVPSLTIATIPEGLTELREGAFYNTGITTFSIPDSVDSISQWAFSGSPATSITVNAGNETYASVNGVLFNKAETNLLAYPIGNTATSYTISPSVTKIKEGAFWNSRHLTSINIPSTVTSVEAWTFSDSPNLETVTYASDSPITNIAANTFISLPKLRSIELPPNLVRIEGDALKNLPLLTTITIPASVNTIGENAFLSNSSLVSVYFLGDAPATVLPGAFGSGAPSATAYILPGATGYAIDSDQKWNGLNVAVLYNVTYNSKGGSAVATAKFGGSIQAAPVSTRAGYTLAGWSVTDGGNVVTFPHTPTASGDITLYAKWTKNSTASTSKTAISSYAAKFSAGSSVITQTGKAEIKKIVNKAGKDAKYTVTGLATKVIGVTDSKVKGLAKARAEKVKAYLIKLGVKKSNITIKIAIVESGITPKTKILAKYVTL